MERPKLGRRAAGLLLHPTSLPGPHGIGDLGPEAERFVDFLAESRLGWWQMLPVGPVGAGDSPYSSPSSFAGSPLLISLERLADEGLLEREDLAPKESLGSGPIDYDAARGFKEPLLRKAFTRFAREAPPELWSDFRGFYARHSQWLDDWSLYESLKEKQGGRPWTQWAPELRARRFRSWERETLRGVGEASAYRQFSQFLFARQWARLRGYAAERGVSLIGDVPIFVAHESADVWANQELFRLDEEGRPLVVSGVPPDYFSEDGQLWGNPHYDWETLKARGYDWWIARLGAAAERFDAVRLDHFIGFHNFWEIPGSARSAREGEWTLGPGAALFEAVRSALPGLELIAEDLGSVSEEVLALRDRFELPGMRVLQFAFGEDSQADSFLPHNYPRRTVAYTGTHDNDTVRGWYDDPGTAPGSRSREQIEKERHNARVYLKSDGSRIHWDMISAVLRSTADTAIVPVQDLLGLGSEARMNRPGTASGNWRWRLKSGALDAALAARLRGLVDETGRATRKVHA